jgi:hypothetical protein
MLVMLFELDHEDVHLSIAGIFIELEACAWRLLAQGRSQRLSPLLSPWVLVAVAPELDNLVDHDRVGMWYFWMETRTE